MTQHDWIIAQKKDYICLINIFCTSVIKDLCKVTITSDDISSFFNDNELNWHF